MESPWNFDFVVRVYYEKLAHMLKPLVPKFLPDRSSRPRRKRYCRKTVPRGAETDSSSPQIKQRLLQGVRDNACLDIC